MMEKELWHRIPSSSAGDSTCSPLRTHVDWPAVKASLSTPSDRTSQCSRNMDQEPKNGQHSESYKLKGNRPLCRCFRHCRGPEGGPWKPAVPQGRALSATAVRGEPLAQAQPEQAPGAGAAPERQLPAGVGSLELPLS